MATKVVTGKVRFSYVNIFRRTGREVFDLPADPEE